jgi:hypothetical protein
MLDKLSMTEILLFSFFFSSLVSLHHFSTRWCCQFQHSGKLLRTQFRGTNLKTMIAASIYDRSYFLLYYRVVCRRYNIKLGYNGSFSALVKMI